MTVYLQLLKRNPAYARLWLAQAISLMGDWFNTIVLAAVRATEGALTLVPWSIREAGLALGLPRWRVILAAVLPVARPGLVTGVLLAFARAAGEAAPLLLTSLGNNFLPRNPWNPLEYLTKAADTLPQRLYSLAVSPYEQWHAMGWAAGIILLLLVIVVFLVGRLLTRRNH